jgi:hypothetical protein
MSWLGSDSVFDQKIFFSLGYFKKALHNFLQHYFLYILVYRLGYNSLPLASGNQTKKIENVTSVNYTLLKPTFLLINRFWPNEDEDNETAEELTDSDESVQF